MAKLSLTMAVHPYDRVRPILDGRVEIEGCEINILPIEPSEAFLRTYQAQEFDVTEMSVSSHIFTTASGTSDYVAIPAFVSRMFRHSSFYIRTDRGIEKPEDLRGKLVGVPEYQMTAALWARGILSEEYGVKPQELHWRTGGQEQPGRIERTPLNLPPGFDVQAIPRDRTLTDMLATGELDAVISARAVSSFTRGAPHVGRLWPDFRTAEEAYYRKTKLFPMMHMVGLRRSLHEEHPWLATSLYKAFRKAKDIALAELAEVGFLYVSLPWLGDDLKRAQAVVGKDIWPYGVEANRRELEVMTRWSVEQGLAPRVVAIEELFARGTLVDRML
jgi:4,5-dihydroxyphthalate decarboxylase